jgi:hypothetical protein
MPPDDELEPDPPEWEPITEPRTVYRFLQGPVATPEDFRSDGERGKTVARGEHPELLTGMSVFVSEETARKRWADVKDDALRKQREKETERDALRKKANPRRFRLSIGDHIAEVVLGPGAGIEIAGPADVGGHLTIRGSKDGLATRVADVYPADSKPT